MMESFIFSMVKFRTNITFITFVASHFAENPSHQVYKNNFAIFKSFKTTNNHL